MKIAIIGAGGMRTPLLLASILGRAERIGLDTVSLADANPARLSILGGLGVRFGREIDTRVRIERSTSVDEAVEGASHVVTTIRAGGEAARARDERIALDLGIIGQETTGAAGFTMAARNLPALVGICLAVSRRAPHAWILNFTNPSGLIAQGLRDEGFERTVGICDSPPALIARIAAFLSRPLATLDARVFGLNHLSWVGSAALEGADILPSLLGDDRFLASVAPVFDPALLRRIGLVPVEYLFYYYHREKALEGLRREDSTRGEKIESWNAELLAALDRLDPAHRFDRSFEPALKLFGDYVERRNSTYMEYARDAGSATPHGGAAAEEGPISVRDILAHEGEGYAGVALDLIEAMKAKNRAARAARIVLSVPCHGSVDGMDPEDVVEVTSEVDAYAIRPLAAGAVPEGARRLMRQVKDYEKQACGAIRNRSRSAAARALMSHPLVESLSVAARFVERAFAAADPSLQGWTD